MKKFKILFLALAFLSVGVAFSSCGGSGTSNTENQGKEYTSAYVCPMHCEGSGSDQAGKCPVCGMDYVENKDHKAGAEEGHEGHNH